MIRATLRAIQGHRWGILVSLAAFILYLSTFLAVRDVPLDGDGHYTWLWARSIAYDGDVDFTNDYAVCGDPYHHNVDRGTGHPDNPFYVGPSLFWVPAIIVARAVVPMPADAPADRAMGCRGPIAKAGLAMGSVAAGLVVFFAYCAARRLARDGTAAFVTGLFAFASPLGAYATRWCGYSHVYDAACVSLLLLLSIRAYEKPDRVWRWLVVGLALAACVLQRAPNVLYAMLPAALVCAALWGRWRRLALSLALVAGASVALGLLPQLLIYKYLYGRYIVSPQGPYYLQPGHAHPILLLFAQHGGLFYMTPFAWASLFGALAVFRRHPLRPVFLASLACVAVAVYVASMPLDWYGASSLGARRLIPLTPFFVLFATRALAPVVRWVLAKRWRIATLAAASVLGPAASIFVGDAVVSFSKDIFDMPLPQADIYGDGVRATLLSVDREVGNVAIWPAEWVFSLRYGLPRSAWGPSTEHYWWIREYESLNVRSNGIDLNDENARRLMTGFDLAAGGGVRLWKPRGTFVFTPYWPYATHVVITGYAKSPTEVRVASRGFFGGRSELGVLPLKPGAPAPTRLAVPAGGFDSGINEWLFECDDADEAAPVLKSIEIFDENVYPPAWPKKEDPAQ